MSTWIEKPMRARLESDYIVLADETDEHRVFLTTTEARKLHDDLTRCIKERERVVAERFITRCICG